MHNFHHITLELKKLINYWEPKLLILPDDVISGKKNSQGRSIKEIVGHMVDSVSNNTHRIIHLQYQDSPITFPDYANSGNNNKWIAIQNYKEANWHNLVQLWKYAHLHICHIINNINPAKLNCIWISALNEKISLEAMVADFPRHFKLHISEIEELTNN